MRGDDGTIYGLIVADCGDAKDSGTAKWARMASETCPTGMAWTTPAAWSTNAQLQSWPPAHALTSTRTSTCQPAASCSWLPPRPHLFGTESWY
jgi:hypothetical protein